MAGEKLGKAMSEGHSAKEAWDYHAGISLAECGISYPIYWTYQNLYEKIYVGTKNERNRQVLFKVLVLYGLEKMLQKTSAIFETGVITANTVKNIVAAREKIL